MFDKYLCSCRRLLQSYWEEKSNEGKSILQDPHVIQELYKSYMHYKHVNVWGKMSDQSWHS